MSPGLGAGGIGDCRRSAGSRATIPARIGVLRALERDGENNHQMEIEDSRYFWTILIKL